SDRARPTGGRGTARLLPGAEREGPVHALSAVSDSISLVMGEVKGMLTNEGRGMRRAAITVAAVLLLLPIFGSGCAPRAKPAANPALGRAQGSPAVNVGDLMSSQDRARLEALASARAQESLADGYRIGPDDLLEIRIPDLLDVQGAAPVARAEAGRVVECAPVADSAPVSPEEAAHTSAPVRLDLEALLHAPVDHGRGLNPRVRPGDVITVSPAGSVLVDGWVQKPGSYPVTRGLTLSGALAAAGGDLFPADRRHATVKRVLGPGEERSFTVDLVAVADGRAADVPITDGDVVRVPASTIRLVPWGFYSLAKGLVYVGG